MSVGEVALPETLKRTSILLVEDSPGDASLVESALAPSLGFEVQCVSTVRQAAEHLKVHSCDCLLADLGLPDAQGLDVVDALRVAAVNVPIVVLTAHSDDLGLQAIQRGAAEYLLKGELNAHHLQRTIEFAIERSRLSNHLTQLSALSSAVMHSLGDGIIVLDAHGRVTSANPAAVRMLGTPTDLLLKSSVADGRWDFVRRDGEAFEHSELPFRSPSTSPLLWGVTVGIRRLDRAVSWVELSTYPLLGPGDVREGLIVSMRDISQRLAADEAASFHAALLKAAGQAIVVTDPEGRIAFWNPAAESIYGWSTTEVIGRSVTDIFPPVESIEGGLPILAAASRREMWSGEVELTRRDGSSIPVLVSDTPVFDDRGELVGVIALSTDISERKRAEETSRVLAAIVASTADAVFSVLPDGSIATWNKGAEELFGYLAEDAIEQNIENLKPLEGEDFRSVLSSASAGETTSGLRMMCHARDGSVLHVSITVSPIHHRDGGKHVVSVIARDVTDRVQLEEELTRQATLDTLTGLPNRTLLNDRLTHALARGSRHSSPSAVLFLDVDQFKVVNDAGGHLAGDQLLIAVAERIRLTVRASDTVARFGGDEFVVVCEETDVAQAEFLAERLGTALREPFDIGGRRQYVSVSIGIATTPPLRADAEALLSFADAAMYEAKAQGRSRYRVFDQSLGRQVSERLELGNDLRDALDADSLGLFYQPLVELKTGRILGVEALARWRHPTRDWISPEVFVPLAESHGMSAALDAWVLARACRDFGHLRESRLIDPHVRFAVNVSARNLGDRSLPDRVRQILEEANVPAEFLDLEITETALIADTPSVPSVIESLRSMNIGISLDDFGTGYSSLTHVRELPVTTIKIDRSFTHRIADRPDDMAIVSSIINLALALDLEVIAEGVERMDELLLLDDLGCHAGQGFIWSPALPIDELEALLCKEPRGVLTPSAQCSKISLIRRYEPSIASSARRSGTSR